MYYTYDTQGNILRKAIKFLEDDNMIEYPYIYSEDSDKLIEFDGEALEYDEIGNPTLYRCMSLTWVRGRMLSEMDDGGNRIEFTYDAHGIRNTKKTSDYTVTYHYENGKLLREETIEADVVTKTIDYLYGAEGVIGIIINGDRYLFRKNIFGDVTHIYNANGVLVGKYSYTAFGCTTIDLDVDGIATENPIRYRSYYCDFETGLYYLKSRYYDPDFGRFLNVDDISYLNPDTINGLNLYAYCGNNPVMNVDPNGTDWWNPFTGDWSAVAKIIGGTFLAIVGVTLAVASMFLPSVPGIGLVTQAGISAAVYGGVMVASVFNSQIQSDMVAIGGNPFNSDAGIVRDNSKSAILSFYKGIPVFKYDGPGGSSASFGVILLDRNDKRVGTLNHEWGHNLQLSLAGFAKYGLRLALPSLIGRLISDHKATGGIRKWVSDNYYSLPWERTADYFGGVTSRPDRPYLNGSLELALAYFALVLFI